ncbi:VOC family protein [Streptomyces sp. WAC05374]|uniref:VOC family protein n=1 Tax=Streptomyces sp. WAC05374 TaxID=2487420 RepID=UPI000F876970|nr:VOC family protein [Streptomyces sp. WAC05374]RST17362.1 VOC family protein [Streptomyces sp. WAC05374]TDF45948.1 VOC family protein [Streptomyces sp. WAC05374]TDF48043.1 VOC family protein [Streptomyces sp. WAC05374]TDF52942.1 VOC family protein [Streptomyces sp. WAC05374]
MLTTRGTTGSPDRLDLATPDLKGAESFYGALFGWRFGPAGPEAGGHGTFRLQDGRTVAGATTVPPGQAPPGWTLSFRTPDADVTAAAVRDGGGTVLIEPTDVAGLGRTAVFADPAGVGFAVWEPGPHSGLDVVNEPYSLSWTELYTRDPAAAMAFYGAVLGIESSSVPWPDGTGSYLLLTPPGGDDDSSFGGVVPLGSDPVEAADGPCWEPYFEVPDTDTTAARAREFGGTVRLAPTETGGVGRFAKLTDPYGARFAVITSTPAQP